MKLTVTLPLASFALEVDFETQARVLALMGPSGAGKTSLLEAIAGLRPARGRIEVGERVLLDSARRVALPAERRRIGYVPQDALLFPHLNVEQNVRFGARETARGERALKLLELTALRHRSPRQLSGGERQRVALARALATEPSLLLLDEPLASLDVELKERLAPFLLELREETRVPMIYVTHQAAEAQLLADEVVFLERGRVSAQGPLSLLEDRGLAPAETLLSGTVRRTSDGWALELRSGDQIAILPSAAEGSHAVYRVAADDLMLARERPAGLSARNIWPATVISVDDRDETIKVVLEAKGVRWCASITAAAHRELALTAGGTIFVAVKAHALRRL